MGLGLKCNHGKEQSSDNLQPLLMCCQTLGQLEKRNEALRSLQIALENPIEQSPCISVSKDQGSVFPIL